VTDAETQTRPLGPKQEGSDAALVVLRAMADWRSPVSVAQIASMTSLPARQVADALTGLLGRGRVVKHKAGEVTTFILAHRLKADVAAVLA
jgi:hypothetical protein